MNRRSFLAGLLGSTAAVALPLPALPEEVVGTTLKFTNTPALRYTPKLRVAYVGTWGAMPQTQVFGSIAAAVDASGEGGTVMIAPGHEEFLVEHARQSA